MVTHQSITYLSIDITNNSSYYEVEPFDYPMIRRTIQFWPQQAIIIIQMFRTFERISLQNYNLNDYPRI